MPVLTLDFAHFASGTESERREFGQALLDGFKHTGFVKLVNHGFSKEEMADVFEWNRLFFNLPQDQKAAIANEEGPKPQRGWSRIGAEKTGLLNPNGKLSLSRGEGGSDLQDAKEHFDIGPPTDPTYPNKWPSPDTLPSFQENLEEYFSRCQSITLSLLTALALAMGLPADTFTRLCHGHASELRLNHYPAIKRETLTGGTTSRIWPHTDFGIITLLAQDAVGGLEIQDRSAEGGFVPVPREDAAEFVVNIGDCLERWTNGVLRAGLHRVSTPMPGGDAKEEGEKVPARRSVAFFLKAHRGMSVAPIGLLVSEERPSRYEDMTALAYQQLRTGIVY
ncbi:putative gibberellin 20-oxidase [Aspergillus californicus]